MHRRSGEHVDAGGENGATLDAPPALKFGTTRGHKENMAFASEG